MKKLIIFLLCMNLSFLCAEEPIIIGIAGGTGSGKTTIAHELLKIFGEDAVIIEQDNYYKDLSHLPPKDRLKTNFDEPAAFDEDFFYSQLIQLKQGSDIEVPQYDFKTQTRRCETIKVPSKKIIIVEGILLFAMEKVPDLIDLKIYVDCCDDLRLIRRIERDMSSRGRNFDSIKNQYLSTVRPMHYLHVEPTKKQADIIIQNDKPLTQVMNGLAALFKN